MSWGQLAIWKSIRWLGEEAQYFNLPRVLPIVPGHSTDEVVAAVGVLVGRHEALRTTFVPAGRATLQQPHLQGTLVVRRLDAEPGRGRSAAEQLSAELAGVAFDHAKDWPIRCGIVLENGRPTHVAFAFSHLSLDLWAVRLVERELLQLLEGDVLPPPTWTPVDQAEFEAGGKGAARGARSLDYWRRTLRSVPAPLFRDPEPSASPERFVRLGMESAAAAVAATCLAERCGASTGTVLLAATAAVLAAYTGRDSAVLRLISANRNDERTRGMVGSMAENALFVLDVSTGDFDDAVRRSFTAATTAYRFAQYDPLALDSIIAECQDERASGPDLSAFFNDARLRDRWDDLPVTDGSVEALRRLVPRTEVTFVGAWERQDATFFVHATYASHACLLFLMADTAVIPRPSIETLLRAIETMLVESAAAPVELARAAETVGIVPSRNRPAAPSADPVSDLPRPGGSA